MAESGSMTTNAYAGIRSLTFNWSISGRNSEGNWIDIRWDLVGSGSGTKWYYTRNIHLTIDGEEVFSTGQSNPIQLRSGTYVAGGTKRLYNAGGRNFSASLIAGIYNYSGNCSASGSWTLPTLAVNPTIPNWINVSGSAGGNWVNKDDPRINVSWGGATSGTYTIDRYSVDVARYGTNSYINVGNVNTSSGSGSVSNEGITEMGALSGGQKLQVRVGMRTTNGTWWGHTYWSGTLTVFSSPTAPSTFTSPTSVEIDNGFNLTWSGASAGSNGIAGYDLEARAYNGSSWTGWERILNCGNKSSYSVAKIKDLKVNGVGYSTNGEKVQFQYRIRTSDGIIATSAWKTSNTISMYINAPTTPRKSFNIRCNK